MNHGNVIINNKFICRLQTCRELSEERIRRNDRINSGHINYLLNSISMGHFFLKEIIIGFNLLSSKSRPLPLPLFFLVGYPQTDESI